jgi:hypothetical protein
MCESWGLGLPEVAELLVRQGLSSQRLS